MEANVTKRMSRKERAILVSTIVGAAIVAFFGFAYAGLGGALLGVGCVGGLVVFLDRYWLSVFLIIYLFLIVYFWNVGL